MTSRLITLWIHEPPNFSTQDIVLSPELLASFGPIGQNELLDVQLPPGVEPRDPTDVGGADPLHHSNNKEAKAKKRLRKAFSNRTFVFKPSQGLPEQDAAATRSSQLQLSLCRNIASIYGFSNRQEVILTKVPLARSVISHVELYFRDQYVGRADMWRLTALLEDTCVYVGQKISLAGSVRATIGRIFINERKVTSGYVAPETKTIFRSESAKYHLFLQFAREMWDFDEDGEVYLEKALTGFIPELLRRWRSVPTNHVLSIVLFARVWYEESELHMLDEVGLPVLREEGDRGRYYIDYYKVIVDLESQSDWKEVISMLKEEVFRFQHDILLIGRPEAGPEKAPEKEEQHAHLLRRDRALLAGKLSASHEGNILEAINLALNPFDEHYIDRDLNRTGLDLVIITAGTGHFRVNKQWLRLTTERMIDNGIGLDLVCLTKMPLHSVPLFYFTSEIPDTPTASDQPPGLTRKRSSGPSTPGGLRPSSASGPPDPLYFDAARSGLPSSSGASTMRPPTMGFYSIPHWIDASFYNLQQDQPFRLDRFVPRVKMREIQQIGYMENEISDVSLPYLDLRRELANVSTGPLLSSMRRSSLEGYSTSFDHLKRGGMSQTGSDGTGGEQPMTRQQRRSLRERFDREAFRDLDHVPLAVKVGASAGSASGAGGRLLGTVANRETAEIDNARYGFGSFSGEIGNTRSSNARFNRLGRDSLRNRPALESHAEDEDWHEHEQKDIEDQQTPLQSPFKTEKQRERPLSMAALQSRPRSDSASISATSSMQNLLAALSPTPKRTSGNSRPASLRSVSTLSRSLRPLQPIGKAEAYVAPLQASDLVADMSSSSGISTDSRPASTTAPTTPAEEAASLLLGHQLPTGKPSPRRYASTSTVNTRTSLRNNWLWNSFTGSTRLSSSRPSSPPAGFNAPSRQHDSTAVHPKQEFSAASLRIQALLKGAASPSSKHAADYKRQSQKGPSGPAPASALLHQRDVLPAENTTKRNDKSSPTPKHFHEASTGFPSPISIPTQLQQTTPSASENARTGDGMDSGLTSNGVKSERDQDPYEQALEEEEARARYAQKAQVEKQTLVNPSNPRKSLGMNAASSQLLRWQHLFPRRLNRHVIKWRSITTPACLPLTTFYLPTKQELMEQWAEYPHTLSISADLNSFLVKRSSSTAPALAALREMTSQRLAQGFQFIVPVASGNSDASIVSSDDRPEGATSTRKNANIPAARSTDFVLKNPTELFQPGTLSSGIPILLGMSNQIHRLSYDRAAGSINVERYIRKMPYDTSPVTYKCCIWPRHLPGYQTVQTTFKYPDFGAYDWTLLDSLVTGHAEEDSFTEGLRYWRTRFVIVPTEGRPTPMIAPTGEQLDDEEIRLIGMDRLADMFARARWRGRQSKQPNNALLRFIPTSLDPSMSVFDADFVRHMEAVMVEDEQAAEAAQKQRAAHRAKGQLKGASLDSVVIALAHDKYGVKIADRLWNRRVYKSAFTGTDLTTWLLEEYTDVRSREEAVAWGEDLMRRGLFEHVNRAHGFLDGHYFYRLRGDFIKRAASVLPGRAAPEATPHGIQSQSSASPLVHRSVSSASGNKGRPPLLQRSSVTKLRAVKMSRSMIIDVDPGRKSERAETAFLHYDISHNPANGFNAQLHWLGTTARFIEDTVQNWTRTLERYGLKLIEAPIGQICDVGLHNPFQAAVPIHLSLAPPPLSVYAHLLPPHTNPRDYFEWAILRHFGFILDQEASDRYPSDVEIIYESRPSRFDYSQFVHRSGVAFVQVIGGVQGFLWLNNRLFNSHNLGPGGNGNSHRAERVGGPRSRPSRNEYARGRNGSSGDNVPGSGRERGRELPDPDRARREFEAFCGDPLALHRFYTDAVTALNTMARGNGAPLSPVTVHNDTR